MSTWNAAWQLLPKNSESPTEADDNMRGIKGAIERRIRNEHDTYNDATAGAEAADWRHKEGSARCWYESAEPANSPSAGSLAGGHLWVDSDDTKLKVYSGAAWVAAGQDYTTDQSGGSDFKAKVLTTFVQEGATAVYKAEHGITVDQIMGIATMGDYEAANKGVIAYGPYADDTYVYLYGSYTTADQTFRCIVFYTD